MSKKTKSHLRTHTPDWPNDENGHLLICILIILSNVIFIWGFHLILIIRPPLLKRTNKIEAHSKWQIGSMEAFSIASYITLVLTIISTKNIVWNTTLILPIWKLKTYTQDDSNLITSLISFLISRSSDAIFILPKYDQERTILYDRSWCLAITSEYPTTGKPASHSLTCN